MLPFLPMHVIRRNSHAAVKQKKEATVIKKKNKKERKQPCPAMRAFAEPASDPSSAVRTHTHKEPSGHRATLQTFLQSRWKLFFFTVQFPSKQIINTWGNKLKPQSY
jgi:hypothetical protein